MAPTNPPNLAAIVPEPGAQITIQERPIPTPGPNDLLIHNQAIAANPADWKIQAYPGVFVDKYPTVLGSDVCGTVISIGSSVTDFAVGDRITGFAGVIYNSEIDHGAWQTYTLIRDISAAKIPESMSWEEGSVFPMAIATAGVALHIDLGIPRPSAQSLRDEKEALFVWGGSSSVGSAAVQMGKNLGLKVFATASLANKEYIESLGATKVFDYKDPDVVSNILHEANKFGVTITKIFDSISENGSMELCAQVLSGNGEGGDLAIVLPFGQPLDVEGVNVIHTAAYRIAQDESEFGKWLFNDWLKEALEKGSIVPAPKIQIVDGGIGAAQKVFDRLKEGVSATKLVVKVV